MTRWLIFLALILFSLSIAMPWAARSLHPPARFWSVRYDLQFWSFMTVQNNRMFLFADFWLQGPQSFPLPYHQPLWNGLYNGWALVFVLQIITIAFSITYLLNLKQLKPIQENHSIWLVILPAATLLSALYQMYIQQEVVYSAFSSWQSAGPSAGFWAATLSAAVLLFATLTAQKETPLSRIPQTLRRSFKKRLTLIIALSIVGLFIVPELHYQSGITKAMNVENTKDFTEIHANPEKWEPHFNRITSTADFFRARVTSNSPQYAYCQLEVPIASYRTLQAILTAMGYSAHEPIIGHLDRQPLVLPPT